MNPHYTVVEQYRGFTIVRNVSTTTYHYNILGSVMAMASVEAARRVIDTYLKTKNYENKN